MTITEPMTLVTDYLLAALVCIFARRLWRAGGGAMAARLWSGAFFASAAAALLGGTVHGFAPYLGPLVAAALWKGTVWSVGAAGLLLLAGAAFATLLGAARRWLLGAALLKFGLYAAWMATHDDFRYVIYDYAPALLAVLILFAWSWWRRRDPAAPWVAGGLLVSFAAAAVQALRLAPHPHFNHNDLYHVVQMGAFWLLYRGGLRLRDR